MGVNRSKPKKRNNANENRNLRQGDAGAVTLPMLALLVSYVFAWIAQRTQIYRLGTVGQRALVDVRRDVRGIVPRRDRDAVSAQPSSA